MRSTNKNKECTAMFNSLNPEIPGVSFSTLESGLEILSLENRYASAKIAVHGAHIIDYTPVGEKNLLWMSRKSHMAPGKPIRGGVPVCWPWFGPGPREGWPGHGFARREKWEVADIALLPSGATRAVFTLDSSMREFPMAAFPFTLHMIFTVGKELEMTLVMVNKGEKSASVSCALHTYFAVSDVRRIAVTGLDGAEYFDHTAKAPRFAGNRQQGDLTVGSEVDYVFFPSSGTTEIVDPDWGRIIRIEKSGSDSTVVWNPWIEKAKIMPDYDPEEYPGMICVECADAECEPRILRPGVPHQVTQKISLR